MTRYSKVSRRVWTDPKVLAFGAQQPHPTTLLLYLLTCDLGGPAHGLLGVGVGAISDRLGWSTEETDAQLERLEAACIIKRSKRPPLIWLINSPKHDSPHGPKQAVGWSRAIDELPECPLREIARRSISMGIKDTATRRAFKSQDASAAKGMALGIAKGIAKGMASPITNGSPLGMAFQEQEQEQDQEQQQPQRPSAVDVVDASEQVDALEIWEWLKMKSQPSPVHLEMLVGPIRRNDRETIKLACEKAVTEARKNRLRYWRALFDDDGNAAVAFAEGSSLEEEYARLGLGWGWAFKHKGGDTWQVPEKVWDKMSDFDQEYYSEERGWTKERKNGV